MRVRRAWFLALLGGLLLSRPLDTARGDALVVTKAASATTIAEVFVEADRVRVELEIGVPDLKAFAGLLPDPIHERLGLGDEPLAKRLPPFMKEGLVVTADGEVLPGRPTHLEGRPRLRRDPITGEELPAAEGEQPEFVLAVVLEYPFAGQPAVLSIRPPGHNAEGGRATANIGFITYHLSVPVSDFRYLGGEATLDLDWDDPFYSRFRNRNLKRQYDAPIQAFLYVDAYEVRKEIVARPKDLQHWVDLGLEGRDVITVDMQGALKEAVVAFLEERAPVTIDGKVIPPVLDRIHFLQRTLRTTGVVDPPQDLAVGSATLGVIFAYPIEGLPQHARMTWDLWSPRVQTIPAAATDEAGGLPSSLTPEDPVLHWENFLKSPRSTAFSAVLAPRAPRGVPVASLIGGLLLLGLLLNGLRSRRRPGWPALTAALVLVVGGVVVPVGRVALPGHSAYVPKKAEAEPVVQALLANVYRAFDVRGEGRIYDALARSVSGDLLATVYLETQASLELANQGGARVKVEAVDLESIATTPAAGGVGFQAHATWQVTGSVGHWGHIHRRTNAYDAMLTLRPIDGEWRITDLEVLGEERR